MSNLSGVQHDDRSAPPAATAPVPTASESIGTPAAEHAALFRAAQTGDRGAFGQIVQLYQDRVYNAVVRLVGDREEARDLTQETFTRALSKIDGFRGEAQPYTWLFRIALNLSISQLRKVTRRRTFSLDSSNGRAGGDEQASGLVQRIAVRDSSESPAEKLERVERDAMVLSALGSIDAEHRAVLVMRDIEGFDYQQMAELLGLPLGTLKSRLFRARIVLREALKSYLDHDRQ
jgi:RNA polymerase sigma-70 factor (ECF subfamily)